MAGSLRRCWGSRRGRPGESPRVYSARTCAPTAAPSSATSASAFGREAIAPTSSGALPYSGASTKLCSACNSPPLPDAAMSGIQRIPDTSRSASERPLHVGNSSEPGTANNWPTRTRVRKTRRNVILMAAAKRLRLFMILPGIAESAGLRFCSHVPVPFSHRSETRRKPIRHLALPLRDSFSCLA